MGDGSGPLIWKIIKIVIIVFVLFGIVFLFFRFNIFGLISDAYNDFTETENQVDWNEEYFINNPEIIVYEIEGRDANIFLRYFIYDSVGRWQWKKKKTFFGYEQSYVRVGNIINVNYKELEEGDNKILIDKLDEKSPEEGLEDIVNRVLQSARNNYFYRLKLFVYYNGKKIPKQGYNVNSPELKDLDGFIDKLNQISYGVEKNARDE